MRNASVREKKDKAPTVCCQSETTAMDNVIVGLGVGKGMSDQERNERKEGRVSGK